MKTYTRSDLSKLSNEELGALQRSLAQHIETENEAKARLLNSAILDEKNRRDGWMM